MDLGLTGTVAVMLNGNCALGSAVCRALSLEGATVATLGDETIKALEQIEGSVKTEKSSESRRADLPAALGRIRENHGSPGVAVIVQPAGSDGSLCGASLETELLAAWHFVEEAVLVFHEVLPAMQAAGHGRLILVGSIELKAITDRAAAAERSVGLGALGMMKALAGEVGPSGVTCNSVLVDRSRDNAAACIESAAASVAFLSSRHSSFLTGAVIGIDGGRTGGLF